MIKYKVKIDIDKSKEQEWVQWMKEKHIRDVVNTGYFTDFNFYKINIIENGKDLKENIVTFEIVYTCNTIEDYYAYKEKASKDLQREHTDKFDGYFHADRVVYTKEDIFD